MLAQGHKSPGRLWALDSPLAALSAAGTPRKVSGFLGLSGETQSSLQTNSNRLWLGNTCRCSGAVRGLWKPLGLGTPLFLRICGPPKEQLGSHRGVVRCSGRGLLPSSPCLSCLGLGLGLGLGPSLASGRHLPPPHHPPLLLGCAGPPGRKPRASVGFRSFPLPLWDPGF